MTILYLVVIEFRLYDFTLVLAFTCFDCFACTLPVSFAALGDPVCPTPALCEGVNGLTIAATRKLKPTLGLKDLE